MKWWTTWWTHICRRGSYAEQWDTEGLYAAAIEQLGIDVPVIDWCEEDGVDDDDDPRTPHRSLRQADGRKT